jgi:Uma2 family endonuclease
MKVEALTMSIALEQELMTMDEFLALPEDGIDRWLFQGELREMPKTVRNRYHSQTTVRISNILEAWLEKQPKPHGMVLCGEAGVRLLRNPDTIVGIDVAYISADVVALQSLATTLIDGVPLLAVEILSPSDTQDDINEKIDLYLRAGVALVWIVDPHHKTVKIFRANVPPVLVNIDGELTAEPHLPGFRVAVKEIFE